MKKVVKVLAITVLIATTVAFTSCASTKGVSGVSGQSSIAGEDRVLSQISLVNPKDYDVLGSVSIEASEKIVFGFPKATLFGETVGGGIIETDTYSYALLLEAAKAQYPNCDAVINIKKDYEKGVKLPPIYSSRQGKYTGTAIKIKESVVTDTTTTITDNATIHTQSVKELK